MKKMTFVNIESKLNIFISDVYGVQRNLRNNEIIEAYERLTGLLNSLATLRDEIHGVKK